MDVCIPHLDSTAPRGSPLSPFPVLQSPSLWGSFLSPLSCFSLPLFLGGQSVLFGFLERVQLAPRIWLLSFLLKPLSLTQSALPATCQVGH